jgi:hypothetical protein
MKFYTILFLLGISCISLHLQAQNSKSDSVTVEEVDTLNSQTPFRKGKWITGLGGRISTSTSESSGQDRNFTNQYGINFSPGTFIADRWVVGLAIDFARISSDNVVVDESDFFQIGPFVRFYTSRNTHGSVYFQVGGGYAKLREKTAITGTNFNRRAGNHDGTVLNSRTGILGKAPHNDLPAVRHGISGDTCPEVQLCQSRAAYHCRKQAGAEY